MESGWGVWGERLARASHSYTLTQAQAGHCTDPSYRPIVPLVWCVTVSQQASTTCVICLSRLQPGNTVRRLACLHLFHTNCVDAWLLNNRSESLCKC